MAKQAPGERIAPHSEEAEQAVLGALMLDNKKVPVVMGMIRSPDIFYSSVHREIFKIIGLLHSLNAVIDIVTVASELERTGKLNEVGGRTYISGLAGNVASAENVESHANILLVKYKYRRIIDFCRRLAEASYTQQETAEAILERAVSEIFKTRGATTKQEFKLIGDVAPGLLEELDKIEHGERTVGIPTGFKPLDDLTGGLSPGLIIIAGRPGMGKTAFVDALASNQARSEFRVGVVSMETDLDQYALRHLCAAGKVDSMNFRRGHPGPSDWDNLNHAVADTSSDLYYVDDSPEYDINAIVAKIWAGVETLGLEIVYIDHLQLIRSKDRLPRREQIANYCKTLVRLSHELKIPIVVASQLGRQLEERRGKRPRLSDLKESGDIEQDANVVIGLFRPIVYATKKELEQGRYVGVAEIIILKQRNGPTGTVEMTYTPEHTRFEMPEPLPQLQVPF